MKKMYKKPIIETTQLNPANIILAGSPGTLQNSGNGTDNIPSGGSEIIGG